MKFLATTTLKSIIPVLLLVSRVVACPPDDETLEPVTTTLKLTFDNACAAVKMIGDADDLKWFIIDVTGYYMSKEWLTKSPPKGWEKERDNVIKKCHQNTYNYCETETRNKVAACVKGMAGSLMLKYGATVMAYCPILDKKAENFEKDDKAQLIKFFTQLCQRKGKTC